MILNSLAEIKKFFASDKSSSEFLEEWNELSEDEKKWFKEQPLT